MRADFQKALLKSIVSAIFIALGLLLPLVTGQLPQINRVLLPMHIPVLLCGLVCGWQYGLCVGFVTPLLRSLLFGLPVFYPTAAAMAFELCIYGLCTGLFYGSSRRKNIPRLYASLAVAMLCGRAVRGVAELVLLSFSSEGFKMGAYLSVTLVPSLAGAVLQLLIVPAVMLLLNRAKVIEALN